jgi:hypothetical protein
MIDIVRPFSWILVGVFLALVPQALAAGGPEPGLWRVTTTTNTDDVAGPERASTRCLRPDDVSAIDKTFVPELGAACKRTAFEWTGTRLSWRIQCTAPVVMDNSGEYTLDTPQHYVGEIIVKMVVPPPGRDMVSRTRIEGERIGACPP